MVGHLDPLRTLVLSVFLYVTLSWSGFWEGLARLMLSAAESRRVGMLAAAHGWESCVIFLNVFERRVYGYPDPLRTLVLCVFARVT